MSNETALDPNASAPAGLSEIERVVDTFIAPSKTFEDIRRSSSWWMPFLIMLIFSAASAFVIDRQVGFDRAYENSLTHLPPFLQDAINKLPPDQKAATIQRGVSQQRNGTYGAGVFLLIIFSIYSLLIWASFNFGLGAKLAYKQVFAVTWYAALPYIFRSILTIIILMFVDSSESFLVSNPVGTNPAYYMPDAAGWLKGFLISFDAVGIWSLILMILGMAIVSKKSFTQSAVIVVIFWLLGVLAFTGLGAISG
jgi:hypothetical protein